MYIYTFECHQVLQPRSRREIQGARYVYMAETNGCTVLVVPTFDVMVHCFDAEVGHIRQSTVYFPATQGIESVRKSAGSCFLVSGKASSPRARV